VVLLAVRSDACHDRIGPVRFLRRNRRGRLEGSGMKWPRRWEGLSAETVEKIEKYATIVLGAIEPIEKLIELISQFPR